MELTLEVPKMVRLSWLLIKYLYLVIAAAAPVLVLVNVIALGKPQVRLTEYVNPTFRLVAAHWAFNSLPYQDPCTTKAKQIHFVRFCLICFMHPIPQDKSRINLLCKQNLKKSITI